MRILKSLNARWDGQTLYSRTDRTSPHHGPIIPGLLFSCLLAYLWLPPCLHLWRDPWKQFIILTVHELLWVSPDASHFLPFPTRNECYGLYIAFLMFATQTERNVTIPSPDNCTSPSLCWTDGLHTWTIKNVTHQENIAKCE